VAILTSPLGSVDIPEVSITEFLLRRVDEHPDKPAVIDGMTGRTLTYSELREAIFHTAGGLAETGFGKGDVLAIMAPNIPEYAVAFHAVVLLGGTVTTINPTYTDHEVLHQLVDANAKYLVTIGMFLETAQEAAAGTHVEEIYTFDGAEGSVPFASLIGEARIHDQVPVDLMNDIAVLPYSSGTTGLSKGVMLTHHNLVANLAQAEPILEMEPGGEVLVAVLPFFHIYGMQVLMNGAVANGATVITMPRFELELFLNILEDHAVTRAYVVPPIVLALAKHPMVDEYDLSALKVIFSGAAPLGADVSEQAAARTGAEAVQGYGLTETSPVTHSTKLGEAKPGSVGYPLPLTECRIVDPETGEDCAVGEDGEIWIRGPQVMKGYLNNPEATADCIDADGFFHTGDIGHVDEDGHYYIVDRLKELIKYKGFQVPPAELEALLLTHPSIADAAVIPVPDEEAGELPKAYIVLKPAIPATAHEIMDYVAEHVATYKQIRIIEFINEIPKSASGKILRRVLRDMSA
jgi:acyl-CoA synthetase (AMP-forming)/AMP-acid ligase II